MCFKFCYISLPTSAKHQSEEHMNTWWQRIFHSVFLTSAPLLPIWLLGSVAISVEVKQVKVMSISSTNKIKLYFQVTFSLVLPSMLFKFTNQLTQELNTAHWCFLVLNELLTVWTNPRLAILETAAPSSTWYPKISYIQMARHRKSSLYGRGIAGFDKFIQKKSHITLRSCLVALCFDLTTLTEIAVYE